MFLTLIHVESSRHPYKLMLFHAYRFNLMYNLDGTINQHKAQLVVQGFLFNTVLIIRKPSLGWFTLILYIFSFHWLDICNTFLYDNITN